MFRHSLASHIVGKLIKILFKGFLFVQASTVISPNDTISPNDVSSGFITTEDSC